METAVVSMVSTLRLKRAETCVFRMPPTFAGAADEFDELSEIAVHSQVIDHEIRRSDP
jgi:hypothetical protein